jgi:hypothetical protein
MHPAPMHPPIISRMAPPAPEPPEPMPGIAGARLGLPTAESLCGVREVAGGDIVSASGVPAPPFGWC